MRTASGSWLFTCRFCDWHDVRGLAPAPWAHGVHFYARDEDLVAALADYLAEGWAHGGDGIVIATAEHRELLGELLARRGLVPATADGRLVQLDAADTLRLFMRDGSPDPLLFQETVGALVRQHAAGAPLRAFGEMVDLLWAEGNSKGALRLESLWGRLQSQVPFTLLCSYARDHLQADDREVLCGAHDHVAA